MSVGVTEVEFSSVRAVAKFGGGLRKRGILLSLAKTGAVIGLDRPTFV